MKKTIELTLEQARDLYGKSKEIDQLLLANFTLEELMKEDWENITTYDDVRCGSIVSHPMSDLDTPDVISYKKMCSVIKALNPQGWKAKFDGKQRNWCLYWSVRSDSSGFSIWRTDLHYGATAIGSRLWFASKERAQHFMKYFTEIARPFYEIR